MPYNANQEEQSILEFWDKNKIFEKSVSERPENTPYVFYDGPPFATGLPHYGHIVASLMKDVVPRYYTMRGYRVERKWGWDCHGLPIENIVEKDLHLNTRKDILDYGVDKFNEACRATVLQYAEEWKKTIHRMGRWVDMEHDYKTMDVSYMESVWWVFRQLWDHQLIYKGHRAMHICPRCVTTLSNFEVTQGYKELKDLAVIALFPITDTDFLTKYCDGKPTSFVAWTTTPWSIPTTMGLAVGADFTYVVVAAGDQQIICVKDRLGYVVEHLKETPYHVVRELKGKDITGISYDPPFEQYKSHPDVVSNSHVYKTHSTDYVSVEEGTGIVTINGAFGDIDFHAAQNIGLPIVINVTMQGTYTEEMGDWAGRQVKPASDTTEMDVEIMKKLQASGRLWRKEKVVHSYPHCWRCDTPLLNYVTTSWFVRVTEIKKELLENNEKINWVPDHMKHGRFGKWLEGAKDWAVSRSRYWGTPLPVWESADGEALCVGSVAELEKLTGVAVTDLHKHLIDHLIITKDGKEYHRIPEVLDCWFESGAMPYAQMHYPFENKEKFEAGFPAEFIAEGQDQTRGWFYTLHVLATALTQGSHPSVPVKETVPAFRNVIVNGIVLAEDGKKMSKRLKNYPDPMEVLERYGADAMRYYFVSSPVMSAENLNFSEAGVREVYNKVVNTVWNVLEFYRMFAGDEREKKGNKETILDTWILTKLHHTIHDVTEKMNEYTLAEAARPIGDFITELSQWYVRRSRDRFKGDDADDKAAALATLREVLLTLSKLLAPFTPFIAERVYGLVGGAEGSVHLQEWPEVDEKYTDETVLNDMAVARKIVEMGLGIRAEAGIKVRQPLAQLAITNDQLTEELRTIIAEELHVKEVIVEKDVTRLAGKWIGKEEPNISVALNVDLTDELKQEGLVRELVRAINQARKEKGLTIQDTVSIVYTTSDPALDALIESKKEHLGQSVLAHDIRKGVVEGGTEVRIDAAIVTFSLEK